MRLESSVTLRILLVSENCIAESAILTEVRKDMVLDAERCQKYCKFMYEYLLYILVLIT